ncbi:MULTISPECIES: cell division protein FtsX [Thermus]|uniref:Cell division protein FtsX n=1 Tax=Thermus brockianus TaxID=56956 RepID=A0A1J0LQW5_THEBO|nr:permease-like cell division protein FtsX [Thermus brockianus]APD08656.1 cell division protein FtsX [Thermus brockianus]BDG15986.1 cell division protein FtsX [Thermus brockianus]
MYAIRQGLRQILRHPTASLATFFTALVSFALLYFLGLLLWNLERVVETLERDLEVAAFLKPEANLEAILTEIQAWPEVGEVRLQTKEEALAQLVLDYPYLAEAKDLVENPLPDTLRLRLKDPEEVRKVAERLKNLPGVEEVEYGGELTERLVQVLSGSRLAMGVLVGLLLLNTFFSVMGAIRLSVESRKEALSIMLLVGATRRFIQGPFVVEGLLLTLGAGALALVLGGLLYRGLAQAVQGLLPFVPVLGPGDLLRTGLGVLLLAGVLGAGGAYMASRAYLKEV